MNQEPLLPSLRNSYNRSWLIVTERDMAGQWKKMRYFVCQFFDAKKLCGHFAYVSLTKPIWGKGKVSQLEKVGVEMIVLSDHVN